eukprot:749140-Pyramimonas_sp.AAC.1
MRCRVGAGGLVVVMVHGEVEETDWLWLWCTESWKRPIGYGYGARSDGRDRLVMVAARWTGGRDRL